MNKQPHLGRELKRRGCKNGGWIAGAVKHPGALRKALHVPEGETIPAKKLAKAAKSKNPTLAKRARLAQTLKGFALGGPIEKKLPGPLHEDKDEKK